MNAIKSKGVFLHILLALTLVFCAQNNAKSTEESSCQSHDHGVSDTCAQYNLGVMYRDGEGVPQDYAEAVKWYRKAAEQDYADAQYNLGVMYYDGRGIPQDHAEAVKWFRKAAGQNHAEAQYNLGVMYRNGEGVPQDYVRAYMWFNVAAIKDEGAAERRESLAALMTAEQIAEAQRLSSAFVSALESEQE
ncbi:MAG TPA: sel1 repeat family protein [Candidatus Hydrogenedentes bacterium]|nr:sel1 repeat family protein [Candidatus Hydrogenedentota bacterium]